MIGRQYIWQFVYPGANEPDGLGAPYSYEEMVVPTNTTVTLDIVSAGRRALVVDPANSAASSRRCPATTTTPGSRSQSPGIYRGQCAFLCGRGHARMIATVKAVPPAQFEAWLAHQKQLIAEANAKRRRSRARS